MADDQINQLDQLRSEGRVVLDIPVDDIAVDHLARDRVGLDSDEMRALAKSIFAHGQRIPIEVAALPPGSDAPYGLISGWRRLNALNELKRQTKDDRFDYVQALVRQPKDSADAYLSMVEENEVRVGLSYYERAKVAAETTQLGVFETEKKALLTLFASASRAKRSRIRQFLILYHAFNDLLKYPHEIGERLGLALSSMLKIDPTLAAEWRNRLRAADAETLEAELLVLGSFLPPPQEDKPAPKSPRAPQDRAPSSPQSEYYGPGWHAALRGNKIVISGDDVSEDFFDTLIGYLNQDT